MASSSLQCLNELDKLINGTINASVSLAEDLGDEDSKKYQSELNKVESGLIDLVTMCNDLKLMKKAFTDVTSSAASPYDEAQQADGDDPASLSEKFEDLYKSAQTASKATFDPKTHPKYLELKKYLDEELEGEDICEETGDGDLVVDKVQTSLYCPITRKLLEKAVTSKQCRHSYSEMAILGHIRKRKKGPKCPVCNKDIAESDLVPNRILRKMVKRKLASEEVEEASSSDTNVVHL